MYASLSKNIDGESFIEKKTIQADNICQNRHDRIRSRVANLSVLTFCQIVFGSIDKI